MKFFIFLVFLSITQGFEDDDEFEYALGLGHLNTYLRFDVFTSKSSFDKCFFEMLPKSEEAVAKFEKDLNNTILDLENLFSTNQQVKKLTKYAIENFFFLTAELQTTLQKLEIQITDYQYPEAIKELGKLKEMAKNQKKQYEAIMKQVKSKSASDAEIVEDYVTAVCKDAVKEMNDIAKIFVNCIQHEQNKSKKA